jgi:hypothetical protein
MLLSEILGVERDTDFGVKGYESFRFNINTTFNGMDRLYYKDTDGCWIFAKSEMLTDIIYGAPGNIIRLPPPLTDEQREQLKAIWTLGGRWLAKDKDGTLFAYARKPGKNNDYRYGWWAAEDCFSLINGIEVSNLVSWSDPEPFDIGKALGVGE